MATHLIFDFFGTLVNYSPSRTEQGYPDSFALFSAAGGRLSYEGFLALWSESFEKLDVATAATLREFSMLEGARLFLDAALPDHDSSLVPRLAAEYLREWNGGVRYIEGLPPVLEALAERFDLSIITNTHDPRLVPEHLAALGVDHLFTQVVTSVELGIRKPSPAIFSHALERLGVDAADCVYIGDSYVHDYEGASASGLSALLIDPDGETPVPEDARLGSVLELRSAV